MGSAARPRARGVTICEECGTVIKRLWTDGSGTPTPVDESVDNIYETRPPGASLLVMQLFPGDTDCFTIRHTRERCAEARAARPL